MKNLLISIVALMTFSSCNDYQAFDNGVNALQAADKLNRVEVTKQRVVLKIKSESGDSKGKHLIKHTIIYGEYNVGDTVSSNSFHTATVLKIK